MSYKPSQKSHTIIANFKSNHTRTSTKEFVKYIDNFIQNEKIKNDIIIFPSASALDEYDILSDNLSIGTQNAYCEFKGSYTGESTKIHLDEFNIKTILIGHSERRHILKETQELMVRKFNFYKDAGFKIIYCVGEPLEVKQDKNNKNTNKIIQEYICEQLNQIDISYENLLIAYEPVWAIGTGISASLEDIKQIHKWLKTLTNKKILYGGSVKEDNIKNILECANVDGALIGTASWIKEDFKNIISISDMIKK